MNRIKAFTLIEVLTVIVIIGILAGIAVPMVRNYIKRAMLAEAVQALDTIRTCEKAYYLENGVYLMCDAYSGNPIDILPGIKPRSSPNVKDGDLDGTYFSQGCYRAYIMGDESFWAICYTQMTNWNDAPKHEDVERLIGRNKYILMDETGYIWSNIEGSGYPTSPPH